MQQQSAEKINGLSQVVRASHLMSTSVQQDVVLLDAEAGKYYGFDAIGSDIWNRIETPVQVDALCADLAADYDGDLETIRQDVMHLLNDMLKNGLVEVCPT